MTNVMTASVLELARSKFVALRVAIDAETNNIQSIKNAAEKVGVARSTLVLGTAGFMFAFLFLGFGAQFFSHMLGMLYPMYASFKAIETRETTDDTQWLTYWVVFALFSLLECFVDTVLFWFPFYFSFKVAFLIFCQLPSFRGADFLYQRFARPMFLKHAPVVEEHLAHVRDVSQTIIRNAGIDVSAPTAGPTAPAAADVGLPPDELFGPSTAATVAAVAKKTT